LKDLADKNVKISGMGQGKLRIVTHLDYTEAMHGEFLHLLKNYNG
jgi:threonine aldolase